MSSFCGNFNCLGKKIRPFLGSFPDVSRFLIVVRENTMDVPVSFSDKHSWTFLNATLVVVRFQTFDRLLQQLVKGTTSSGGRIRSDVPGSSSF
jgi:hypothetical protein